MQQSLDFIPKAKSSILDGLNNQQKEAVTHKEGPLLIIAGAGTGKTTVVTRRIAHIIEQKWAKPSEILALTFTEKAAAEMEERVDQLVPYGYTDMWIGTFHAFGDRLLRDYSIDLGLPANFKVLTATEQAIFMRHNIYAFDLKYYRPIANPLSHIQALLNHFSRLKDELITADQYLEYAHNLTNKKNCHSGLDPESCHSVSAKEDKILNQVQDDISCEDDGKVEEYERILELAHAYERYQDLMLQAGNLDFGDLIYLSHNLLKSNKKVLNSCHERFKYVMVDEFQDTNYAQNELVKLLAGACPEHSRRGSKNITVVGDDDQCLPGNCLISTPKGLKQIKNIKKNDHVYTGVGKGHIGVGQVNKTSVNTAKRQLITFMTKSGQEVTVTNNHKMFCFVPKEVNKYYYVYLMERKNLGWRIGITNDLKTRLRLERSADRIIAIKACKTEDEARYYETLWSLRYSIPTVCFKERQGIAIKNQWLTLLYKEINTNISVRKLADDIGVDLNAHHFCLDGVVRGQSNRLKINIKICQRNYRRKGKDKPLSNPQIRHELSLQTSDQTIIETLKINGFALTDAKVGKRLRIVSGDSLFITEIANQIKNLTDGIIEEKFCAAFWHKKTANSLIMPASNVLPGHYLPVINGHRVVYDQIIDRRVEYKKITTYDLEIDKTHNFIANNVVVHNSIYRFRGASISNILKFKDDYKEIKQVVLNQNYRSSQEILDASYKLIQHNNPDRLEVQNKIDKRLVSSKHALPPELLFCDSLSCEADSVAKKIKELKSKNQYNYKDFAILVRANSSAEPFIQSLNIEGIPHLFSGTSGLFAQPEIKMLVAFLKSLVYSDDSLSLYQLATSELYGINHETLTTYFTKGKRFNRPLLSVILNECEESSEQREPEASGLDPTAEPQDDKSKLEILANDIKQYRERKSEPAGELLYSYLKEKSYLKNLVDQPSVENEIKIHNIAKFFDRIAQFNHTSDDKGVLAFISNLELILEVGDEVITSDIDPDIDAVNILTAHASKGLEYPVVFIVSAVAEKFPSRRRRDQLPIPDDLIKERLPEGDFHLQEERRLFYVAATRAKEYLYLTAAEDYGGKRAKKLSQFVLELLDNPNVASLKHKLSPIEKIERFAKIEEEKIKLPNRFKSDILRLSRQQIDDYYSCPQKFYFAHVVKIPLLENHFLMYGTAIHAALDHYFNRKIAGESPTLDQLLNDYNQAFKNIGFITREQEELRHKQGILTLTRFFEEDQKNPTIPNKVEEVFEFYENNVKINGRYDLVCNPTPNVISTHPEPTAGWIEGGEKSHHTKTDPSLPEIKDFKTSDVKEHKDADRRIKESTQMMIYALAWYEKYKVIPKTTLYFIESGLSGSKVFSLKELEGTKKMIFDVAEGIRAQNMKAKPEPQQCKYCPYSDICPNSKA